MRENTTVTTENYNIATYNLLQILSEEVSVNRKSAHVFQVTEQNHDLESELK
jgi:hypothetical protein